eukprot:9488382-Pyramimonas_sp.AAC.2
MQGQLLRSRAPVHATSAMNKLETLGHYDSQSPLPLDLGKCRNIDVKKLPDEGWDRPNMDVVVFDDLNALCDDRYIV